MVSEFSGFLENDLLYGLGTIRKKYLLYEAFDWENIHANRYSYALGYFSPHKDFVPDLDHFSPRPSVQSAFIKSISKHQKYSSILDYKELFKNCTDEKTVLGRKSKAGINWAKEDKFRIHFNIDDIDMKAVVEKTPVDGCKSITGSELRYIYRNRDDPDMEGIVQFWNNGCRTVPPWITNKPLWESYKPKNSARVPSTSEPIAARVSRRASIVARDSEEMLDIF